MEDAIKATIDEIGTSGTGVEEEAKGNGVMTGWTGARGKVRRSVDVISATSASQRR